MLELKKIIKDYPTGGETVHALKGVDPNASTEEMVRFALRAMVMKG